MTYYCPYCKNTYPNDSHVPCPSNQADPPGTVTEYAIKRNGSLLRYTMSGKPVLFDTEKDATDFIHRSTDLKGAEVVSYAPPAT